MEIRKGSIGDEDVARIYTGEDIVHPLPVQDGLVLWYDFMGRKNSDEKRGIAEDLSGNGNHGELVNFALEEGSGYEDGLFFDGVDDTIAHELISFGVDEDWTVDFVMRNTFDFTRWVDVIGTSASDSIMFHTGNFAWYSSYGEGRSYIFYTSLSLSSFPVNVPLYFSMKCEYIEQGMARVTTRINEIEKTTEGALSPSFRGLRTTYFGSRYRHTMGDAKSYRLYNRALTSEEVAHNYAIEKERWNL